MQHTMDRVWWIAQTIYKGFSPAQSPNQFFGGPTSGGAAAPLFRALVNGDIPAGYINTVLPPLIPAFINGCNMSSDAVSPNTVVDITAGVATDSTNAVLITPGAFTKSVSGAWAAGSGSNGMGNGLTFAASTWYHVMLANNNGTPDYWFDTSVTGANRPTGIADTKFRRIGSVLSNASTQLLKIFQDGDDFLHGAGGFTDLNSGAVPSANRQLVTMHVPPGVICEWRGSGQLSGATTTTNLAITSPNEPDQSAGGYISMSVTSGITDGGQFRILTNTSQQVGFRLSSAATVFMTTFGWRDFRGRT